MHIAKIFVEYAFDFIIKRASGRPAEADAVIVVLKDEVARANAQNDKLIEETIQSKRWLQNQFERLVPENRASLRDAADPVGKTVRTMKIGNEPSISPIDEASADVLRSHKELSVGDVGEYKVNLEGVFKTNGACRVKLAGTHKIISGKITDPSVGIAGNIYTRALNEGATLVATAKPTLQNGEINRLFISNARIADE